MINQHSLSMPTIAKHQTGVVLIISLIMLLALTLIGVTSSSVTSLEEKMAANNKNINLAFQAAEATLRDVEGSLQGSKRIFTRTTTDAQQTGVGVTQKGDNKGLYSVLQPPCPTITGEKCPLRPVTTLQPFYKYVTWTDTAKTAEYDTLNSSNKLIGLYKRPRYIIEELGCTAGSGAAEEGYGSGTDYSGGGVASTETVLVRITAHGWGSNENSVATLQSVVKITYTNGTPCQ
ncbi:MAG: PilX N-terminal domain-containing pilus assembly protein [Methylococcales bacterium]|nr:PilX N-terminal domain-containing pilus assembly protein [Methylococcales bacterium]